MGRIFEAIKKEKIECLPCAPISLDYHRFMEYADSGEHPAIDVFERPAPRNYSNRVDVFSLDSRVRPILRYFLDGSRRTYKVADVISGQTYLPLIAGQVGVAVVERTSAGDLQPMRAFSKFEYVLAFPDQSVSEEDVVDLQSRICAKDGSKFVLLRYSMKQGHDPVDLGVACIMKRMQDLEVETVAAMSTSKLLSNDSMLVIDGPLRFKEMRGRPFDILQFRNVIGLSKTFQPSFNLGKGKRVHVGSVAVRLAFGQRTPVYRADSEGDKRIGMWYLRIRRLYPGASPLDGVVKPELYAIDPEDREDGIHEERVNTISAHILRERNVTPFGTDSRWASHIYPIYTAEQYIRSRFMNDASFMAMF